MWFRSIKSKIIATTLICVFIVGIVSNTIIYYYLSSVVIERSVEIDKTNAKSIATQLEGKIDDLQNLLLLCASDKSVVNATKYKGLTTLESKTAAVSAQEQLNTYLLSSINGDYINKLLFVNTHGLMVQASTRNYGEVPDYENVLNNTAVKNVLENGFNQNTSFEISSSITNEGEKVLVLVYPVFDATEDAVIYMEISIEFITDLLAPFSQTQTFLLANLKDAYSINANANIETLDEEFKNLKNDDIISQDDNLYQINILQLSNTDFHLHSYTDLSLLTNLQYTLGVPVLVFVLTAILLAIGLAVLLSTLITKPVENLVKRIRKISENDFSFDASIEKSQDEFGQIGKVINEMMLSISTLLKQTQDMYEHRKNTEIALLQSQINPHFLYNTLDSVYWIAVIQKNQGIAKMTRSLVNLLKNIAKGTHNKISIDKEIGFLHDYIAIQSVRYLEMFEFRCKVPDEIKYYSIVKLTLQPLVENAIFHGIEPTGRNGIISLDGKEDGDDIVLSITDDGIGMTPQESSVLLTKEKQGPRSKASMNGIGIYNVHMRLQLLYGKKYGLTIESEKNKGTTIFVRIPKEITEQTQMLSIKTEEE